MRMSESIVNLSEALARFQEDIRNPENTATNPQFRSKYAPLNVVINTIKPIMAKYGLSFIQSTGSDVGNESIVVTTLLLHKTGEWIESDPLTLPAYQVKGGGVKDFNAQGAGSAITYARRYSLSAILGLSSEDDDDGNGTTSGGHKDTSVNKPNSQQAQAGQEAEKKRQELVRQAKEKAKANSVANTNEEKPETTESKSEEAITTGQEKAIDNLLKLTSRKKTSFDKEAFIVGVLAEYGVETLKELTSEQAKQVIAKCNTEMKA